MGTQPLTDAEFDRLAEVLQRCGRHAMNIEMLDGFLAALICGPETVLPSEYLRFGEMSRRSIANRSCGSPFF